MGDEWDDEDFEVPTFAVEKPAEAAPMWDDEEEQSEAADGVPAAPTAAQIEAAEKKREQEAIILANKMKFAAEANETPEQKKLREKRQAEEADIAASADLFGAAASGPARSGIASLSISRSTSGVESAPLKNIRDHQQFATSITTRFTASDSTPFNIGAFYTKLTNEIKGKLPVETLQDAIEALQNELENKKAPVKKGPAKKSKQQMKVEKKKHEEVFGGDDYEDKYSHYGDIEDDFM
jgi:hypothetical protein